MLRAPAGRRCFVSSLLARMLVGKQKGKPLPDELWLVNAMPGMPAGSPVRFAVSDAPFKRQGSLKAVILGASDVRGHADEWVHLAPLTPSGDGLGGRWMLPELFKVPHNRFDALSRSAFRDLERRALEATLRATRTK